MGLIVVEGVDASGKSTLIKRLGEVSTRSFSVLSRYGSHKDDKIFDVIEWLGRCAHSGITLVLDRHPLISEPIYGEVLRHHNRIENEYSNEDLKYIFRDTIDRIIYCRPPLEKITESLKAEPQLNGVYTNIGTLVRSYDYIMRAMAEEFGVPVITYNWTADPNRNIEQLFFGGV